MPAIVWTTDGELRITSWAGDGREPQTQIGRTLNAALGSEDPAYPPVAAALRALRGEASEFALDWRGRSFHTCIAPLRGPDGRIAGSLGVMLDITEQRRAGEALLVAEARLAGIAALAEDAIVSAGEDRRISLFNAGAEKMFGYQAGEVMGRPLSLLLPGWSLASSNQERSALRGRRKDGGEFSAEAAISRSEAAGEIIRLKDISERRRAEEELRARAEQQAAVALLGQQALRGGDLSALMQQACALVAQTLSVEFCKVLELLEGGQDLLLRAGVGWKEGLVGRRRVSAGRGSHGGFTLASTSPVVIEDLSRERRFDEPLLTDHGVVSGLAVIVDTQGAPFGVLGAHTSRARRFTRDDINFLQSMANVLGSAIERTRAEQALRLSNETLRVVNQASPLAIWALDTEGRVTLWNPAAERLFGWSEAEALGRPPLAVPESEEPAFRELLARLRRGEALAGTEVRRRTKDGSGIDLSLWTAPLRDGFGLVEGTLVTAVDLTERKRIEEQLRQSQKLESIGLLAGGIAHDFNNLLTGVMGNVSLALDMMPERDGLRELLDNALRASEHAADLVRQLLAYAGKGRFVVQPLSLSAVVRELVALLQTSIPKKVRLVLDLDRELPPVEADPAQMQQLIMNLVINGAEAIGDHSGVVTIRTRPVELDEEAARDFADELPAGEYVSLDVRDTGCGMDDKTRAQIFDPFFTTKFTGRGLGLAAVSGIVRGHRGTIRVLSEPGQGSCFQVLLPASDGRRAQHGRPGARAELGGRGAILVVDDEEVVRQTARSTLSRHGYAVLEASNGEQALELFREDPDGISLVLLDMSMPVMSGEETLLHLVNLRPDVQVIVSSGYDEIEAIRHFTGTGVAAFLQKPYTAAALAERVKAVLSR